MSDTTPNLSLPYLVANQAQKHVTMNESLSLIDALAQLVVDSASAAAQPGAPAEGDAYILPPGATGGAWAGAAAGTIMLYRDGAWRRLAPREGWIAWVKDANLLLVHDGAQWTAPPFMPAGGGAWGTDATQTVTASLAGFPTINYRRSGDGGRSLAMGFDGANRRIFINRWNTTTDGYIENLLLIGQDGVINFVGAAPPRVAGAAVFHAGASPAPAADNQFALGSAASRFTAVYAATGVIQTSDAREKTPLEPVSEALERAVRGALAGVGVFRWRQEEARCGAGAKRNIGVTAQAVAAAFEAEGLDPQDWALFSAEPAPDPAGTAPRLELRIDQLLLLALAVANPFKSKAPA